MISLSNEARPAFLQLVFVTAAPPCLRGRGATATEHGDLRLPNLNFYLAQNFLDAEQFAAAAQISSCELIELVQDALVPAPSYVVSESSKVGSFAFGEMSAPGSTDGDYFHPANVVWVNRAKSVIAEAGRSRAYETLKVRFAANLQAALAGLNTTTWPMRDSFNDDGSAIVEGLQTRIDSVWTHFLHGTFGLCVANPVSEVAIATKETLQEKLNALSESGAKESFTETEAEKMLELIDAYSQAAMPFSPIEYLISSRKRLVDDLRARIHEQLSLRRASLFYPGNIDRTILPG
jgi:Family of unknown function (DUF6058)